MDEKPDQILEHIETQRNQLGQNLSELESRVRSTTDWRTHFDRNPMLMVSAALGGGILLGAMVGGSSKGRSGTSSYSTPRYVSSGGGSSPSYSSGSYSSSSSSPSSPAVSYQKQRASETVDHVKAALIGFATAKAKEFLNQALPGFDSFLHEAESRTPGQKPAGSQSFASTGQGSEFASGSYGQSQSSGQAQSSGASDYSSPSDSSIYSPPSSTGDQQSYESPSSGRS